MEKQFKTRLVAGGTPVITKSIIDFTGVKQSELEELASATVVINQQAIYRNLGKIPATDTISVRAQLDSPKGGGFKVTPDSMAARLLKMDVKEYTESLKKLPGLDAKTIDLLVKARQAQQKGPTQNPAK